MYEYPLSPQAHLATVVEHRPCRPGDRRIKIAMIENDGRILAAELERHGPAIRFEARSVDRRYFHGFMFGRELDREMRIRSEGSDGSLLPLVEGGVSQ